MAEEIKTEEVINAEDLRTEKKGRRKKEAAGNGAPAEKKQRSSKYRNPTVVAFKSTYGTAIKLQAMLAGAATVKFSQRLSAGVFAEPVLPTADLPKATYGKIYIVKE